MSGGEESALWFLGGVAVGALLVFYGLWLGSWRRARE